MHYTKLGITCILLAIMAMLAGCGMIQSRIANEPNMNSNTDSKIKQTFTKVRNTNSKSRNTVSKNPTTNKTTQMTNQEYSFGWRYVEIPESFGTSSQIAGINLRHGIAQLMILSEKKTSKMIQNQYSIGTYQLNTNQLNDLQKSAEAPKGYQGSWKLSFGQMNGHKPVTMTLAREGRSILISSSIPVYASEINPAPDDPGRFDNRLLGQTGNWVWIAMKGPGGPPMPGLIWGYRQWNRILAVNTQTQKTRIFSIPKRTSETDVWGTTPGFGVIGDKVYIATGNWVGLFPADPSNQSSEPILVPEPQSKVAANQAAMLKNLTDLENQAAVGITNFWNNYVMKGDQKAMNSSWIGNPAVMNHGDYPHDLYWALNFPLKPGTQAYNGRTKLIREIEQLLKSPLMTAWIIYPDSASMKSHFHGTPSTKIPGYHIVNGYYIKG